VRPDRLEASSRSRCEEAEAAVVRGRRAPRRRLRGRRGLGVDLDEHIAIVIEALQPIAPELGLRTAAPAS
jgi:predicted hydrolase (HD superfamily)